MEPKTIIGSKPSTTTKNWIGKDAIVVMTDGAAATYPKPINAVNSNILGIKFQVASNGIEDTQSGKKITFNGIWIIGAK